MREALALEADIAHGKRLVDDENRRLAGERGCETKTCLHAARISTKRSIDEIAEFAERDDLLLLGDDFATGHAQAEPAHHDVLATAVIGVKSGAEFENRRDPAVDFDGARVGGERAGNELEQRGLSCAVATDDADDLAAADLKRNIGQRGEPLMARAESD